ncbi:hypothetical protein PPYR_09192 [Photinus pyralis]|uniref:Lipid-binding serum glycoprotein N-terminal domain-containing protein n=1 Tax=Photinus pyralis TaxID=7054 RepID=A0A5N4ALJ9_PHOPY|nr:uncharacterized protein LOC116172406 [Photinus pyralis]XP_031345498.1 uncharacterized protein LOC116172424 [Photinus pyralis]KAB0798199.1 hypothetical protein PPYR_09192 [Photinus pyralis]
MKSFIVFVCLVVCGTTLSVPSPAHSQISNERTELDLSFIKEHFDNFVAFLKQYDPVDIKNQTLFDMFGMYVNVNNLHVEGFSNMLADLSVDIGFPVSTVKLEFGLPEIVAVVERFDCNIPWIFSQGSAGFNLKDGHVSVNIGYDLFGGLKPTQVITSIGSADFKITGIHYDEELSKTVSDAVNHFLNSVVNSPETHNLLGTVVDYIIKGILGFKTNN